MVWHFPVLFELLEKGNAVNFRHLAVRNDGIVMMRL